jgi:hypothetical protein
MCEKLLNLQNAFEDRRDKHWPAFKSSGLCAACFSQENCLIGNIFGGFQNRGVGSGRVSKALGEAPRNLLSNRSK